MVGSEQTRLAMANTECVRLELCIEDLEAEIVRMEDRPSLSLSQIDWLLEPFREGAFSTEISREIFSTLRAMRAELE